MNEIYIERQRELLRIAVKENGCLKECFIEEESDNPYPGQIYKGIVKNIIPAIKCAFIDIGYSKNCYMYLDRKFKNTDVKKGDEVLVEILKEDIGSKGPKVTKAISVPGSYCVLETLNKGINFSKKIEDVDFKRLVLENLQKNPEVGFTIRTRALGATIEELKAEMEKLFDIYKGILQKGTYSIKPGILFSDEGVLDRILRDTLNSSTTKIFTDTEDDFNYISEFIKNRVEVLAKIEFHNGKRNLFDYYGIEKEILGLRNNKVYLKCGGYLIIDKTEAMYVIDVNSGSNTKGDSMDKVAFNTDMEAAKEICRQIRLRNLSGIVLIDFIDVSKKDDQAKILNELNNGFIDDKNKTVIYPFTELNLVQIARQRRGKSISKNMEEPCTHCNGNGVRFKLSYLLFLIRNSILRIDEEQNIKHIYIKMNEIYKEDVMSDVISFAKDIEALDKNIYIDFQKHIEYFKIEPLLFANQISNVFNYKIYGEISMDN
ncbi:MAG: Rne/Rng family ribonuclease [Clostridiaceae bacterium]|nr:Rne/Rng family ribonuclease [Clostridiaceae bacterium]